jgi:hypothetical protein
VTAKFLVVPSKATRNVVVAERDITRSSSAGEHNDKTCALAPILFTLLFNNDHHGAKLIDVRYIGVRVMYIAWLDECSPAQHYLAVYHIPSVPLLV